MPPAFESSSGFSGIGRGCTGGLDRICGGTELVCRDVAHCRRLSGGVRGVACRSAQVSGRAHRLTAGRAGLHHLHFAVRPCASVFDGFARSSIVRPLCLEEVQYMLGARGRPQCEKPMIRVGEGPSPPDGHKSRVTVLRQDHGFADARPTRSNTALIMPCPGCEDDSVQYDPTQFRGAAPYYLRGRPPYSAELAQVMGRELRLTGTGRLLDVGCGPGTVGMQVASLFEHVTFVEPDAEMLAQARANATAAGLTSAGFFNVTAEDLAGLGLPPARAVTFGQSFHRTDRLRTAEGVYDLLEPGGSIVLIGHDPSRPAPPQPEGTAMIPHAEVRDLVRRFLGPELRSGSRPASSYDDGRFEETLARTRFGAPRTVFAGGRPDIVRDVDDVIANYLSMSFSAPPLFGTRLPEFIADLRALLAQHAPNGRFWDWPGDTALVIASRA